MKKALNVPLSLMVPIVHDGAIAVREIGEGRFIPVLIVDCSEKVELSDLIYAHEEIETGDVTVTWAYPKYGKNKVLLMLDFLRPAVLKVLLEFDIEKQGGIVDGILHANAVYLQSAESGARVIDGLGKGKIFMEVPDTGFLPTWETLYVEMLVKVFRKSGFSKSEARDSAKEHISRVRDIWAHRMKR